jgi:hypothetical protein
MYHQPKEELTIVIPIENSKSRSMHEEKGWQTLTTIIHSAALSFVEVRMSKEQKVMVIEL